MQCGLPARTVARPALLARATKPDPPSVICPPVRPSYPRHSLPSVFAQLLPSHLFCDVEVRVRCPFVERHRPYLYASLRPRAVSLEDNRGRLHQHACPADLPHNLDTPHSNEPPRPFVCTVAPKGRLQHIADYTRRTPARVLTRPHMVASFIRERNKGRPRAFRR